MDLSIDARYLKRPGVGIATYLVDLIGELSGEHEITLLTSQERHAELLRTEYPDLAVTTLPERREVTWEQVLLPRYLRRARPSVHLAPANRGLPARAVASRLTLVVHDLIPLRMPRTYLLGNPFLAPRYLAGTAVSLGRADLIICNSRSTERDVARLAPHRRTIVRYPRAPQIPAQPGQHPEGWPSRYLIYTGGYDPRKNVDLLLNAHALYAERGGTLPLVLLGNGTRALRDQAEALGSAANVMFTGYVDEATKWSGLRAAHALLNPSSWEGFGLPILEAFSAGIPVIAGSGGAQTEVGGDAVLYADPLIPDTVAGLIQRIEDPAVREPLIEAGRRQLEHVRHTSQGMRLSEALLGLAEA